jgi:predicted DNA-binding protein YlxM (UPF0122 family)
MARIEYIKRRLDNWALYRARMNDGGLGFKDRNPLAAWAEDVWTRTSYHGASIPHFDQEAEEIEQAVQALKLGKGHLYVTLDFYYLRDLGVNECARRMRRAVSTVHSQLDQADRWIDAWLRNLAEEKQARRVQLADNAKAQQQARVVRDAAKDAKAQAVAEVISNAVRKSL